MSMFTARDKPYKLRILFFASTGYLLVCKRVLVGGI